MNSGLVFLIPSKGYTHILEEPNILKKILAYVKYISIKQYDVLDSKSNDNLGVVISIPILPKHVRDKAIERCVRWIRRYMPTVVNALYVADDFPILPNVKVLFREGLLRWASGLYVISAILTIKASSWQQQEVTILGADEQAGNMIARYLADKVNYLTLVGNNRKVLDELAGYLLRNYGLAASIYAYEDLAGRCYDIIISASSELTGVCCINAEMVLCYPGQRALFDKSRIVMEGGYIEPSDFFITSANLSPLEALYMIELIGWKYGWIGFEDIYSGFSVNNLQRVIDSINTKIKISGYICEDKFFSYNQVRKKLFHA